MLTRSVHGQGDWITNRAEGVYHVTTDWPPSSEASTRHLECATPTLTHSTWAWVGACFGTFFGSWDSEPLGLGLILQRNTIASMLGPVPSGWGEGLRPGDQRWTQAPRTQDPELTSCSKPQHPHLSTKVGWPCTLGHPNSNGLKSLPRNVKYNYLPSSSQMTTQIWPNAYPHRACKLRMIFTFFSDRKKIVIIVTVTWC